MSDLYAIVYTFTLAGVFFSTGLAYFGWRHRHDAPMMGTYALLSAGTALASLMYCVVWSTPSTELAFIATRVRFTSHAFIAVLFPVIVLQIDGVSIRKHRWWFGMLAVVPVIAMTALWTNDRHELFFRAWERLPIGAYMTEIIEHGPAWHLHAGYSYAMTLLVLVFSVRGLLRSDETRTIEHTLMLVTTLTLIVFNIPGSISYSDYRIPMLVPVSFVVADAFVGYALYRHVVSSLVPMALDAAFNSMEDPLLVINRDERITAANPAAHRLAGVERDTLIGVKLRDVPGNVFAQLAQHNEPTFEIEIPRAGYPITFDVRISPITVSGRSQGTLMVLRDITQRAVASQRSMELRLEQEKVRMLERFIGDTSHDLRTPLTIMDTALYIAERTTDPAKRSEKFAEVSVQIHRVNRIIESLQLMTRLDAMQTIRMSSISLQSAVEPLPDELAGLIQARGHTLIVDCDHAYIKADLELVRSAVHQLIENAAQYTPNGGTIRVLASVVGESAVIAVSDNGAGIPPDELPHVFDRFSKASPARSSIGAGLGLAIVRKIAELHHGLVDVSSEQGKGSTFLLLLPARPSPITPIADDLQHAPKLRPDV